MGLDGDVAVIAVALQGGDLAGPVDLAIGDELMVVSPNRSSAPVFR